MNSISTRELASALERKGFRLRRGGNHDLYYFFYKDKQTPLKVPISRGSNHDYSKSLLARVIKQMQLDKEQFQSFVECNLSEENYTQILQETGSLPLDEQNTDDSSGDSKRVKL